MEKMIDDLMNMYLSCDYNDGGFTDYDDTIDRVDQILNIISSVNAKDATCCKVAVQRMQKILQGRDENYESDF